MEVMSDCSLQKPRRASMSQCSVAVLRAALWMSACGNPVGCDTEAVCGGDGPGIMLLKAAWKADAGIRKFGVPWIKSCG